MTDSLPAPGSLRAWILASRLPTLSAAAVPVAIGAAVAASAGGFRLLPTLAALWGALFIQIGTNFANDVFDYEKGADTSERLGPTRAVQAGLLSADQMRRGMVLTFALAFAAGLYLAWVGGWPIVAIGILSILSGIAYTGGPYPLGYNGLGDVFVFLFFGFVAVAGTVWVNMLALPEMVWWTALPPGALATAILVVNNLRDRVTDVHAGKRTLAVRFGRRAVLAEYALMLALAYGVPLALVLLGKAGPAVLLPLLTLPLAARLWRRLVAGEGAVLNPVLADTAKLLVLHGLLFAVGLAPIL
ncbi:MAG: 1,4-dihydroxy-2-naphthoate polyprenyltransferase [Acidobacteriota bacterium]